MEYVLYCDESSSNGTKYTDFYGGCMVDGRYLNAIIAQLEAKKSELNLSNEIKWVKVTENYLDKYKAIIDLFFKFIQEGKIKVRIMFRKKEAVVNQLNHSDDKYFKLYYQFLKHAFGLKYISSNTPVNIKIYMDQLPDRNDKCERFKNFLYNMPQTQFFNSSGIIIKKENIVEIDSQKHVIQQCVDIILGAMYFRLNDLHKAKPLGSLHRGKRTIAKEKLYNHIRNHINYLLPNFNIGISTGKRKYSCPHLESPYEHWLFTSKQIIDLENHQNKELES